MKGGGGEWKIIGKKFFFSPFHLVVLSHRFVPSARYKTLAKLGTSTHTTGAIHLSISSVHLHTNTRYERQGRCQLLVLKTIKGPNSPLHSLILGLF